jgi:hypothetical protein
VKDFFVHRIALRLTLPFIIMICVLQAGAVPAGAANNARVQIGFVGTMPVNGNTGTPLPFQNVLLNVVSVRINPHVNAAPNASGWQKIPAPPGIGGNGSNAELQVDLNSSQNIPELFNTTNVKTGTYKIVQLVLDSTNPGTLIPNCPASPTGDGCINYPIQLNNPNGITFSNPDKSPLITTATGKLTTFVMQVSMAINKIPSAPGGAYTVTLTLTPVSSPSTGTITGTVTVNTSTGTPPSGKVRKLEVAAETIGTNTVIATAPIQNGMIGGKNCPPSPGGCFTFALPAAGPPAPATPFGTLYDLAVSGGAAQYAALRLPPLFPLASISPPITTVTITGNQMLGNLTGTVRDACVPNKNIAGATLQLLIPPNGGTDNSVCLSPATAGQCVSVATANTDNTGAFPLPGTITTPSPFANIPILGKNSKGYAMEVTAPGYDSLFVQALPGNGTNKKGGGTCSIDGGATFKTCNLAMMTGYIAGAFPIVPPNAGQTALVQVFAEDHGSNNIESALPMPITVSSNKNVTGCSPPPGTVCAKFSLNVPPSVPIGAFDLFASTIDLYQGAVDPYQGHSIAVISDVPAPAACATATVATPTDPSQVITCVGHGSVTGTVANPNLGESVVLEKLDLAPPGIDDNPEVQITNSIVQNQPPNPNASSNYAFCAPADTYELQKFETFPAPAPSVIPSAAPTPSAVDTPVSVTIPLPPNAGGPNPTPTPALKCPTNCSHPDGTCPGICNNAPGPQL